VDGERGREDQARGEPDDDADIGRLAAQPYINSLLASGEFPSLSRIAADARVDTATEGQFERGLNWLLDGIEADIRA
jgi:hypothetical protein